jgi:hypothetical protein
LEASQSTHLLPFLCQILFSWEFTFQLSREGYNDVGNELLWKVQPWNWKKKELMFAIEHSKVKIMTI